MTAEASVPVRVKPGSSRTRVGGSYAGPYGEALVVAVSARAVEGAATEATVAAVAEALGVKSRQIRVAAGRTSRDKLLAVSDPPADFITRLGVLLSGST